MNAEHHGSHQAKIIRDAPAYGRQVGYGLSVGQGRKGGSRRNRIGLNGDVCRADMGVRIRSRGRESVILAAARWGQRDTRGWSPIDSRETGRKGNRCPLKTRAVPPLAGGLIVNGKCDLLDGSRGCLCRSSQAGKGDNLLAVGRLGKTDNGLGGDLMDASEQGQNNPCATRGAAEANEQILKVSFHKGLRISFTA